MTVAPIEEVVGPLTAWLADRMGTEVVVSGLERPPAGQSNDTMLCQVTAVGRRRHLVVRRQAVGTTIFRRPDVLREAKVLEGLAGTAVPVPAVRWVEPDPGVLGAPFFVMDRVPGRVPVGKPSIHAVGWLPTLTTAERRRLWDSAMDVLASVHDIDWRARHDFLLDGDPAAASIEAHVADLVGWYRWSTAGRSYPVTDAAAGHLESGSSGAAGSTPVLLWGDSRVGNMIFGEDNAVRAALDWETAAIGPAARDVAHWLFFDEFQTEAVGIELLPGWPNRDTTVARYESITGRTLGDLTFFDIMDQLFMATTLIRQADARVARGLAPSDTRMGHDNPVTRMLARRLGMPEPDISPDYLAHRGVAPAGRHRPGPTHQEES